MQAPQSPGRPQRFRVVLTEVRQPGIPREELATGLANLLGMPADAAAQYIANIPCELAVGAPADVARRVQDGLEQIGLGCEVRPEAAPAATPAPMPADSPPLELDGQASWQGGPDSARPRASVSHSPRVGGARYSTGIVSHTDRPVRQRIEGKPSTSTTFDLGRTLRWLAIAALIAAVVYFRDPRVSVETEHGSHTFPYRTRLLSEGPEVGRPLIIALHGNGDTPGGFDEALFEGLQANARVAFLKAPYASTTGRFGGKAWPHLVRDVPPVGDAIDAAAGKLASEYAAPCKPIVLGYSGGAMMAYFLAANYPSHYSTVLPIAGWLSGDNMPPRIDRGERSPRVIAMHGTSDTVLQFQKGADTVLRLQQRGLMAEMRSHVGGHTALFTDRKSAVHAMLQNAVERCIDHYAQ